MRILFAASEGVPFCKTGGLADVVGSLSQTLAKKGNTVRVFLPLYREIDRHRFGLRRLKGSLQCPMGRRTERFSLWETSVRSHLSCLFIDASRFFGRRGLYGYKAGGDFDDNDQRFIFFSRAVLEAAKALSFKPDLVHCHDWQTGLIPLYLKTLYKKDPFFSRTATAFSIHNMAFQGLFPPSALKQAGLSSPLVPKNLIQHGARLSFLKAGLTTSDALHTVSPTYKKEISTRREFGYGLEPVLKKRQHRFRGILNGLDSSYWNPRTDPFLKKKFGAHLMSNRKICKKELQKKSGLKVDESSPLMGFVGRLETQKGIDLLLKIAPRFLKKKAQMICLGQGNKQYERQLTHLQTKHPTQVHVITRFAEAWAHQIYAGVDMFLMPSRFEPCGLGQLIAMRYGAVPVVTPTGGLYDTVRDARHSNGTGFVSASRSVSSFEETLNRALKAWAQKKTWTALQKRGMTQDFSWNATLKPYLNLYEDAIRWHKKN